MKLIFEKDIHTCPECSKTFTYNSSFLKHMKIHKEEKSYFCKIEGCQQKFNQVSKLIKHQRNHLGLIALTCEKCSKIFSSLSNLNIHKNIHKRESKIKLKCFIYGCHKYYLYICTLKNHIKSSHKRQYKTMINNFPKQNFLDIFNYLKRNPNYFKFLDFKADSSCFRYDDELSIENTKEMKKEENVDKHVISLEKQNDSEFIIHLYSKYIPLMKFIDLNSFLLISINQSIFKIFNNLNSFEQIVTVEKDNQKRYLMKM